MDPDSGIRIMVTGRRKGNGETGNVEGMKWTDPKTVSFTIETRGQRDLK